eukprot:6471233-Amphidinium_carterae.2
MATGIHACCESTCDRVNLANSAVHATSDIDEHAHIGKTDTESNDNKNNRFNPISMISGSPRLAIRHAQLCRSKQPTETELSQRNPQ